MKIGNNHLDHDPSPLDLRQTFCDNRRYLHLVPLHLFLKVHSEHCVPSSPVLIPNKQLHTASLQVGIPLQIIWTLFTFQVLIVGIQDLQIIWTRLFTDTVAKNGHLWKCQSLTMNDRWNKDEALTLPMPGRSKLLSPLTVWVLFI
jgi:hypothetical protein